VVTIVAVVIGSGVHLDGYLRGATTHPMRRSREGCGEGLGAAQFITPRNGMPA
jgi:hypothetical protein